MRERGDEVVCIDLKDGADCLDFFRRDTTRFDLAIHCAAIVGGRAVIDGSPLSVATNMALDSHYFRWLEKSKTERAVYLSSSAAYPVSLQGRQSHRPLRELDIDLSRNESDKTYGLAKLYGECLAAEAKAAGVSVYILRTFSGYGLDQDETYPFPAFVKRAREKQSPFTIWGDPESCRDWIHIFDVVNGALAVVEADYREPVNLCTGKATTFRELARLCMSACGYEADIKADESAPQGVFYRVGDPTLMQKFYTPKVTLQSVLRP